MGVFRVAAFAAMTSLVFIPSISQAASSCWYPNEARAAQVRGLQTMLMVGTLQCRRSYQASEGLYNDFVVNQRRFLDANIQILKARFTRENGEAAGQAAYDRFGTSLANQYSEQLDDPEFCRTVQQFARIAAGASRQELLELADAVAAPPASGFCRPSAYGFDQDRVSDRRDPPPPPRVAIASDVDGPAPIAVAAVTATPEPTLAQAAPASAAEPEPAAASDAKLELAAAAPVAAADPLPALVPAAAKLELIEQVKAEPAASPDSPKRGDALQAAIAALQSAVVALQAATAAETDGGEPGPARVVEVPAGRSSK
jgi:hypothetical protein